MKRKVWNKNKNIQLKDRNNNKLKMEFTNVLNVSEMMNKHLSNAAMELVTRAIRECGSLYKFDGEEAIQRLGLSQVNVVSIQKPEKKEKKSTFVLPYNGVCDENCCRGLKQNNGLYTQCPVPVKDSKFCTGCEKQAKRNESGKPDYGDMEDRQAVPLMEYRDPKGKQPISYTKIMKKMNYSQEQVMEEAKKRGMNLDAVHFEEPAAVEKKPKKVEEDKKKGRPKKSKKVLEVQGETNDLFAELIAAAHEELKEEEVVVGEVVEEVVVKVEEKKKATPKKSDEEKALEKAAKELALKEKKEAEKAAKELALKEKKEAEKAAKELALKEKKEVEKKVEKVVEKKESPQEEEADVVKKFEFEGTKYLKSKKSGIIYNMEQEVVGKWNEETQKIDFDEVEDSDEEDEE